MKYIFFFLYLAGNLASACPVISGSWGCDDGKTYNISIIEINGEKVFESNFFPASTFKIDGLWHPLSDSRFFKENLMINLCDSDTNLGAFYKQELRQVVAYTGETTIEPPEQYSFIAYRKLIHTFYLNDEYLYIQKQEIGYEPNAKINSQPKPIKCAAK